MVTGPGQVHMRMGVIIQSPALCTMPPVPTSVNIKSSAQEDKQSAPRLHRGGGATACTTGTTTCCAGRRRKFSPHRPSYYGRRRGKASTRAQEPGTLTIHHPSNSIEAG